MKIVLSILGIFFGLELLITVVVIIINSIMNAMDKRRYVLEHKNESCLEVPQEKEKYKSNELKLCNCQEEYVARFENGTVYAKSKYIDDYVIGYYANEDGHWKVRCASDNGEIGRIMPDDTSALVYFNRLGDLERYKKLQKKIAETSSWFTEEEQNRQYNNAVKNTKLTWLCAEAFGSFIQDIDTFETIAISTGNDFIGAAAAFICLQYECVMDGKYHSFYSAIN